MTTTREAKAAEILKAHRAAARVAKARQLSPAFDAECRAAEEPVGFWQGVGFYARRCRDNWAMLVVLAGLLWFLWKIAAFLWAGVQVLAVLLPIWLILGATGYNR